MTQPNPSDVSRESRLLRLAAMDFGNLPTSVIMEELKVSYQTLYSWRKEELYLQEAEILKAAWREQVASLPGTSTLRKKIEHGMTLSLDVLIQILAGKAAYKDKISAARLMAQLDGRFLKAGEGDEEGKTSAGVDSLAQELLSAVKRQERLN